MIFTTESGPEKRNFTEIGTDLSVFIFFILNQAANHNGHIIFHGALVVSACDVSTTGIVLLLPRCKIAGHRTNFGLDL